MKRDITKKRVRVRRYAWRIILGGGIGAVVLGWLGLRCRAGYLLMVRKWGGWSWTSAPLALAGTVGNEDLSMWYVYVHFGLNVRV